MKSLKTLCTPRPSIFDPAKRDTVLDLTDLAEKRINGAEFFEETHVTEGMKTLLTEAFRRLNGKSAQGLFKLSQSMGGGKTHNLIALGLLAGDPALRAAALGGVFANKGLRETRVVAFTGRESDAPLGIWGELATQLDKKELFNQYYSPLQPPGQKAWINLLKGQPTLILLDELTPYLDSALSKSIGDSNLARVTGTALANLFVALGKDELPSVCVVLTELVHSYATGGEVLATSLRDLQAEADRAALSLEPVRINTDEFYHILRKRLFLELPAEGDIQEVAQGYAKAIRDAKQMDITNQSPEKFAQDIQVSYPFHPAIKDLYARFRENPGFQQTRALIRLMRIVASRLWNSGRAERQYLIAAHDLDLNDRETLSEINQINPTLENAVSHDIAAEGKAVAEVMDANLASTDASDACRLLLMSSLANVPNSIVGLSVPELVAFLCAPGRNLARLKGDVLEKLSTAAWYLHARDGRLFFKNVQNLVAKLESTARAYVREQSMKELRERLQSLFQPINRWCYQEVLALPPIDEIELAADRVTLVITEPFIGQGLNPQLKEFYDQTVFKNRVAFLTGARNTFENLLEAARRLKAIRHIIDEMVAEKVPENDPQYKQAHELEDKTNLQFLSAAKETFTTLHFPTQANLVAADFLMKFDENRYEGEGQVLALLKAKQKYEENVTGDVFRKKCEQRLFTAQVMLWSEIVKRAATNPAWQWHRRDALDDLRTDCIHRDVWRENGSYMDKGPFPQPFTQPLVQERVRNDDTGEADLKILPQHGDTIYAEVGGVATTASQKVDGGIYRTAEMEASFLAVDSTGEHETGPPVTWRNRVTLKYGLRSVNGKKTVELRAAPRAEIRFTTDGSDPKTAGGIYDGEFEVPPGSPVVLAVGSRGDVLSELLKIPIDWEKDEAVRVDPERPAVWRRKHRYTVTQESYDFIDRLRDYEGRASGVKVGLTGKRWLELVLDEAIELSGEQLHDAVESLRKLLPEGQVGVEATAVHFDRGQMLLDWVGAVRTELTAGEVQQ